MNGKYGILEKVQPRPPSHTQPLFALPFGIQMQFRSLCLFAVPFVEIGQIRTMCSFVSDTIHVLENVKKEKKIEIPTYKNPNSSKQAPTPAS